MFGTTIRTNHPVYCKESIMGTYNIVLIGGTVVLLLIAVIAKKRA